MCALCFVHFCSTSSSLFDSFDLQSLVFCTNTFPFQIVSAVRHPGERNTCEMTGSHQEIAESFRSNVQPIVQQDREANWTVVYDWSYRGSSVSKEPVLSVIGIRCEAAPFSHPGSQSIGNKLRSKKQRVRTLSGCRGVEMANASRPT